MSRVALVSKRIVLFVLALMTAVALFMVSSAFMASSALAAPPDREEKFEAKGESFEEKFENKGERFDD
jgi:hypothetical protein